MIVNLKSAAFWSSLAGVAATVCGALGVAAIGTDISITLVAIGGVFIAIPAHHVIAKQQGTATVKVVTVPKVLP